MPLVVDVGEHSGCILVQEIKDEDVSQTGLKLSVRVGTRVSIIVPGEVIKNLALTYFDVESKFNGPVTVSSNLFNSGNASILADLTLSVKDIFGREQEPIKVQQKVYRDQTARWNFDLPTAQFGNIYFANFTATYPDANNQTKYLSQKN